MPAHLKLLLYRRLEEPSGPCCWLTIFSGGTAAAMIVCCVANRVTLLALRLCQLGDRYTTKRSFSPAGTTAFPRAQPLQGFQDTARCYLIFAATLTVCLGHSELGFCAWSWAPFFELRQTAPTTAKKVACKFVPCGRSFVVHQSRRSVVPQASFRKVYGCISGVCL